MQSVADTMLRMAKTVRTKPPHRKVAVITRTRERPLLLQRAKHSIAGQNFQDFLWVIVNDGDAPEPVEVAAAEARREGCEVLTRHLPRRSGMEFASNHGIRSSRSEFIAIHDDDDTWHPDFLAMLVEALEKRPDWLGAASRVEQVTEHIEDNRITEVDRVPFMPWIRAFYLIDMLQQNLFPPIALLFRRSLYDKLGGFDAELPVLGDWDFHLRMLQAGEIGLIDQTLAYYHLRQEGSQGNTITDKLFLHAETDALIRNHWLRRDLKVGRFGLGSLASLARQHWAMWKLLYQLTGRKDS